MTRKQRITFFVNGLKDYIKKNVQFCYPQTIHAAVCLAKKYEQQWEAQTRSTVPRIDKRRFTMGNEAITTQDNNVNELSENEIDTGSKLVGVRSCAPAIKKLSPTGIQERRQKGLCLNCEEKIVVGHTCKHLFLIDGYSVEELEEWQGEVGHETRART